MAQQAFSRTAGAPLIPGNSVRLLKDAAQNYAPWLAAIRAAKKWVHLECYIIRDDAVGREFVAALVAKAREGVPVRVLYDWMGSLGQGTRHLVGPLREAGVEVRCFNPPRIDSPFGWLSRDHRKMIGVDGSVGFVTGLCISARWLADPVRKTPEWRDTGVEVRGPAVEDVERAFADSWQAAGGACLPDAELPGAGSIPAAGEVAVRIVASVPNLAGLYRLDQLIAALAERTLWLTDAYFVGTSAYVHALQAAAGDGVDVRLLVPGSSDIPVLRPITTTGYRPLLEAGVRVFEWNGPMLHAKTAVADGKWARVGSTNLNIASWIGNHELDVVVEDEGFGAQMEQQYVQDLTGATEIVLQRGRRVRPLQAGVRPRRGSAGSAVRMAAGAMRVGNAVEAAITSRRVLGPAEAKMMTLSALALLAFAVLGMVWPRLVAIPLALLAGWVGIALLAGARRARRRRPRPEGEPRAAAVPEQGQTQVP
jgi:cardiolipin synthase